MASSPYYIAFIAVAGTILGTLITSVTQSLTTKRTMLMQRDALKVQTDHESIEKIREERRRIYARYLHAMEVFNLLVLEMRQTVGVMNEVIGESSFSDEPSFPEELPFPDEPPEPNPPVPDEYWEELSKLEEKIDKAWEEWQQALCELQLLAGGRLSDLAVDIFNKYTGEMADAKLGINRLSAPQFSYIYAISVLAAMQEEIGIRDGVKVDPESGKRIG
jgi:hypothetical protein